MPIKSKVSVYGCKARDIASNEIGVAKSYVPFNKVLRPFVGEGVETVASIDFGPNHISLFLLWIVMSPVRVDDSYSITTQLVFLVA